MKKNILYQGGITLLAFYMAGMMKEPVIADLTGVGGLLLIGLGINILELKEVKVTNMIPALVVVVIVSYFVHL